MRTSAFPGDRRVLALVGRLERIPLPVAVAASLVAIAVIAAVDAITGDDLSLAIFYLAAVGAAAWSVRLRTAILLAGVAALAGFTVSVVVDTQIPNAVAFLNAVFRFAFYAAFAYGSALLRRTFGELERRASTDPATGFANRPAFYERAEEERIHARRIGYPITVVLLDMDNLKEVNDQFGHEAGDELIAALAIAMSDSIRSIDVVGRIGGDEFLLLLPDTDGTGAVHLLDRIVERLAAQPAGSQAGFSSGVATWRQMPDSVEDMVREADRLMYAAKQAQRGSVRTATFPASAARTRS